MTVRVSKPEFNLREKISELDKPYGLKGNELLRSETSQEARGLIGAGRKNKVINGDMAISQRGTSFSGITGTQQVYTLDRFKLQCNDLDQAVSTVSQDSSAPDGFSKSLKIQCTTVETSVENYEHARLMYDGEAFDFTDVGFGTLGAKRITVSFWVKSNLTGIWGMNFWRGDANRSNLRTYTIDKADTWEHKVITLSPDTEGGGVNHDNGWGFRINWGLATGANFASSGTALDTWHGFNQTYFYPHDARNTNFFSSTSNNFYLTGVQCEVSDFATEFEHRPYTEELALCQRYFQSNFPEGVAPQNAYYTTTSNLAAGFNGLVCFSGSNARSPWVMFNQKMRAQPTVTLYSASSSDAAGKWAAYKGSWNHGSSNSIDYFGNQGFGVRYGSGGHSFVIGEAYLYRGMWAADAEL